MIDTVNDVDIEKDYQNNKILADFLIFRFSGFNLLKIVFKSNSISFKKKNHINVNFNLLNKTLRDVYTKIFSIEFKVNLPRCI